VKTINLTVIVKLVLRIFVYHFWNTQFHDLHNTRISLYVAVGVKKKREIFHVKSLNKQTETLFVKRNIFTVIL
jgi:5-keto 4-deoxyuronate isomerase